MEWRDEAIILGVRRHGETSVIAEVMTRGHGRHLGLVRGGRGRNLRPVLQAGNRVEANWSARLDEQLGIFRLEALDLRAAGLFSDPVAIFGLQMAAALFRLLPERDPHASLFEAFGVILDHLDESERAAALMLRLELVMLEELGFGLDLKSCASTGSSDDLAYVSPRSGRAVSRRAGEPWRDKLLVLPPFMTPERANSFSEEELNAGFRLTGYFLVRDVYEPRGVEPPAARESFIRAVCKEMQKKHFKEPDLG